VAGVIGRFAASFPPGAGGLEPSEVAELLNVLDDSRMAQGRVGGKGANPVIRSGTVQWINPHEVSPRIFSHFFTLACVANEERGWNFDITGPSPSLQATSYSGTAEEHYDWHMDWGVGAMAYRKVSVVAHLSKPGDYEGGSLQLTNGSIPIDAVQEYGSVTVFPSFILHRVTPVTRGRRLGVVSWVLGPLFV
jgi:PKHD-type hydroxylase